MLSSLGGNIFMRKIQYWGYAKKPYWGRVRDLPIDPQKDLEDELLMAPLAKAMREIMFRPSIARQIFDMTEV
jgi:hypothetical protein